jgi:hypothetical protein
MAQGGIEAERVQANGIAQSVALRKIVSSSPTSKKITHSVLFFLSASFALTGVPPLWLY